MEATAGGRSRQGFRIAPSAASAGRTASCAGLACEARGKQTPAAPPPSVPPKQLGWAACHFVAAPLLPFRGASVRRPWEKLGVPSGHPGRLCPPVPDSRRAHAASPSAQNGPVETGLLPHGLGDPKGLPDAEPQAPLCVSSSGPGYEMLRAFSLRRTRHHKILRGKTPDFAMSAFEGETSQGLCRRRCQVAQTIICPA